jgi:hypothetical protein
VVFDTITLGLTMKKDKSKIIVAKYIRGGYKSIAQYVRDFDKYHRVIDLLAMIKRG